MAVEIRSGYLASGSCYKDLESMGVFVPEEIRKFVEVVEVLVAQGEQLELVHGDNGRMILFEGRTMSSDSLVSIQAQSGGDLEQLAVDVIDEDGILYSLLLDSFAKTPRYRNVLFDNVWRFVVGTVLPREMERMLERGMGVGNAGFTFSSIPGNNGDLIAMTSILKQTVVDRGLLNVVTDEIVARGTYRRLTKDD